MITARQPSKREPTVTLAVAPPNQRDALSGKIKNIANCLRLLIARIRSEWSQGQEIDQRIRDAKNEIFNKHYWKL
jgi:hypothetical protein